MTEAVKKRFFTWKLLIRLVLVGLILGGVAIIAFMLWMTALGRSVPSVQKLAEYDPPVTSRVHAGDGTLIYEFADQHRVFVPFEAIPEHVRQAFVSAEDKTFFKHGGVDYKGMTRGILNTVHPASCQEHATDARSECNP
jgi:penicillin-binding protein 1A